MNVAERYLLHDDFLGTPETEVIDTISPRDDMFAGDHEHYFRVGFSAMRCIRVAMHAAQLTDFKSILDLPSGYGRVLRILKAYFPNPKLAACDLDRQAVDFCQRTFNAIPLYSETDPKDVDIKGRFDLIWIGSLLTHLDDYKWDEFLELFDSLLNPNGLLVITTHGRRPAEWIRKSIGLSKETLLSQFRQTLLSQFRQRVIRMPENFKQILSNRLQITELRRIYEPLIGSLYGMTASMYGLDAHQLRSLLSAYDTHEFGYVNYDSQKEYGTSLASPAWVLSHVQKFADLRLVAYLEYGWDNHQDVVALLKTS